MDKAHVKHGAPLLVLLVWSATLVAVSPWPDSGWSHWARLSAWSGTALLVASLVLMIREARLARLLGGLDAMYRWHHRCGTGAYVLLLVHPLALAAQAWSVSPVAARRALSPASLPWTVNLGWAALLLMMLGLAVTFSPRVGYRRWRALHLPLAASVLMGLLHVFLVDGGSPVVALSALVALAAVGVRIAIADHGALASPYRVEQASHPASGAIEATLSPLASPLRASPGQFVLAAFGVGPGFRGCEEFHPFTVSNLAEDGRLSVTIKALGCCTTHLQRLQPGTHVRLQGPFGDFLPAGETGEQLWIAGGIGITPFIARLRVSPPKVPTTLIYLYRQAGDAAFSQELSLLKATIPGFELLQAETGDTVPDLEVLLSAVPRLEQREVRVCGPASLVASLRGVFERRGLPADRIHWESFDFR